MKYFLPVRCIALIWPGAMRFTQSCWAAVVATSTLKPRPNSSLSSMGGVAAAAPPATSADTVNATSTLSKCARREFNKRFMRFDSFVIALIRGLSKADVAPARMNSRLQRHAHTSINHEHLAGDVVRAARGQEYSQSSEFVGFAPSTRWRSLAHPRIELGVVDQRAIHFCREVAGRDRVDLDVVLREFDRHASCQLAYAALGCRIGHDGRAREFAHQRRDVDDLAVLALDHSPQHRLRHDKRRCQVGGDDLVPLLQREFGERAAPLDASVVEQNVDVAMFSFDRGDALANRVAIGNVEQRRRNLQFLGAQLACGGVEQIFFSAVQNDAGAGAGESLRDREAQSAIGARDERDFAGQIEGTGHERALGERGWQSAIIRLFRRLWRRPPARRPCARRAWRVALWTSDRGILPPSTEMQTASACAGE